VTLPIHFRYSIGDRRRYYVTSGISYSHRFISGDGNSVSVYFCNNSPKECLYESVNFTHFIQCRQTARKTRRTKFHYFWFVVTESDTLRPEFPDTVTWSMTYARWYYGQIVAPTGKFYKQSRVTLSGDMSLSCTVSVARPHAGSFGHSPQIDDSLTTAINRHGHISNRRKYDRLVYPLVGSCCQLVGSMHDGCFAPCLPFPVWRHAQLCDSVATNRAATLHRPTLRWKTGFNHYTTLHGGLALAHAVANDTTRCDRPARPPPRRQPRPRPRPLAVQLMGQEERQEGRGWKGGRERESFWRMRRLRRLQKLLLLLLLRRWKINNWRRRRHLPGGAHRRICNRLPNRFANFTKWSDHREHHSTAEWQKSIWRLSGITFH